MVVVQLLGEPGQARRARGQTGDGRLVAERGILNGAEDQRRGGVEPCWRVVRGFLGLRLGCRSHNGGATGKPRDKSVVRQVPDRLAARVARNEVLLDLVHLRLGEPALSIPGQAVRRRVGGLDFRHRRDSACREWSGTFGQFRHTMALAAGRACFQQLSERMLDRRISFQEK